MRQDCLNRNRLYWLRARKKGIQCVTQPSPSSRSIRSVLWWKVMWRGKNKRPWHFTSYWLVLLCRHLAKKIRLIQHVVHVFIYTHTHTKYWLHPDLTCHWSPKHSSFLRIIILTDSFLLIISSGSVSGSSRSKFALDFPIHRSIWLVAGCASSESGAVTGNRHFRSCKKVSFRSHKSDEKYIWCPIYTSKNIAAVCSFLCAGEGFKNTARFITGAH